MYESPRPERLIQRAVRAGARRLVAHHIAAGRPQRQSPLAETDPVVLLTVRLDERPPGLPGLCLPSRRTVAANTCVDEQV